MSRIVPLILLCLLSLTPKAQAADTVDVALVLVDDVSRSISDDEYELQKKGYFTAFNDPRVLAAIHAGANGQIAVAYIEFADDYEVKTIVDWTIVRDPASANSFVAAMMAAPRSYRGRTAIGAGIDAATKLMAALGPQATRRVIDVCGDGTNNAGREVTDARDDAVKQGITINGLALANESDVPWLQAHTHPPGGLGHYYELNVRGGEGSFVYEIHSFDNFAAAVTRKLVDEIALNRLAPEVIAPEISTGVAKGARLD
jgi:hypothetical protein